MALGYRHLHGIGVPKSCQDSVSYYTRVADKAVAELQVLSDTYLTPI